MSNSDTPTKIHEGKNIKRFREMLGMKQEALAYELGEEWTQKKVRPAKVCLELFQRC